MKTISKHDGKNYEIDVKGDLHEYPDGTIFEVKNGKLIPGKGGGLPDASAYEDGTALIAVDGKFVPAKGYGYLGTAVSWDFIYRADMDAFLYDSQAQSSIVFHKLHDDHLSQEEIAAHLDAVMSGQVMPIDAQFKKVHELGVVTIYADYAKIDDLVLMYDVLSEDYWTEKGMESLGTGLFVVGNDLGTSISDGDFVFNAFGMDSLVLTTNVGVFKIDSALIPDIEVDLSDYVTKNMITSGTVEYEDGVTNLETGKLYLQYEV